MAHWFTYTGGCTAAQAAELDALAETLGMGKGAGLDLFAKVQACPVSKARYRMSIRLADEAITWAIETAHRPKRPIP